MSFVADLHVHSYLSRATSKQCCLEGLHEAAQLKGVRVVGTGDFTHPAWQAELGEKLEPSAPGLFRLKPDIAAGGDANVPGACKSPVDFILTAEISSIYKRDGCCRKVHSVLVAPDLETVAKIDARLGALGNITSDGRPILGLDPRDLLEITLEANPDAYLIPAHIWTPWFSMLGSKSGFDSATECFGELEKYIFAVETGLSSDPPMNWRVSSLDRFCLVSNSDLHSPGNLARNANLFHCETDFFAIRDALRSKDPAQCGGTIDMFPEEGKYHCDGHRKCEVCMEPEESLAHDCLCPVCGKPLVLGVLHRVIALADRPKGGKPDTALPCEHIIPLPEILAEIYSCGSGSKKVTQVYNRLLNKFGSELAILRELDPERLRTAEPRFLDEAIRRLRQEEVIRKPGYDGEYGVIRVFGDGELDKLSKQGVFFDLPAAAPPPKPVPKVPAAPDLTEMHEDAGLYAADTSDWELPSGQLSLFAQSPILAGLNPEQQAAAVANDAPVIIVAGPGTGKTRTLTRRIAHLVRMEGADPASILAVTFTNRAANEMRERLEDLLGDQAGRITVSTFHAFCLNLLRRFAESAGLPADFNVVDQDDEVAILRRRVNLSARDAEAAFEAIAAARRELRDPTGLPGYTELEAALAEAAAVSLDALIPRSVQLLRANPEVRQELGLRWVCVDEYQDVNCAQCELIPLLAPEGRGLCVIGDPDQAIYGFRGAEVGYFLRFTTDFPNARTFTLTRNYRSSGMVVAAANQVMVPGRSAMSVTARNMKAPGVPIRFHCAASAAAEAEYITHEIEKLIGGTALFSFDSDRVSDVAESAELSFGSIAVLVRLRALMQPLAEALTRLGLPVQVVGDQPFMQQPGAREVINALRTPQIESESGSPRPRDPAIRADPHHGPEDARLRESSLSDLPARDAVTEIANQQTKQGKLDTKTEAVWDECRKLAAGFNGSLRDFVDHLVLRNGTDRFDQRAEKIVVMTLHAAKGLEFPVVFLAACEDGIVPYTKSGEEPDLDEERRLLYVGMTRAERLLYITSARKRTLFGTTGETRPSPFVAEIAADLRDERYTKAKKRRPSETQLEFDFPV